MPSKTPVRRYAQGTRVTVESSQSEATRIITKHGGSMVTLGWLSPDDRFVSFQWRENFYRLDVPELSDEAETRRLWRVLVSLKLKPFFELSVEDPRAAEDMLLSYRILKSGATVKERLIEYDILTIGE